MSICIALLDVRVNLSLGWLVTEIGKELLRLRFGDLSWVNVAGHLFEHVGIFSLFDKLLYLGVSWFVANVGKEFSCIRIRDLQGRNVFCNIGFDCGFGYVAARFHKLLDFSVCWLVPNVRKELLGLSLSNLSWGNVCRYGIFDRCRTRRLCGNQRIDLGSTWGVARSLERICDELGLSLFALLWCCVQEVLVQRVKAGVFVDPAQQPRKSDIVAKRVLAHGHVHAGKRWRQTGRHHIIGNARRHGHCRNGAQRDWVTILGCSNLSVQIDRLHVHLFVAGQKVRIRHVFPKSIFSDYGGAVNGRTKHDAGSCASTNTHTNGGGCGGLVPVNIAGELVLLCGILPKLIKVLGEALANTSLGDSNHGVFNSVTYDALDQWVVTKTVGERGNDGAL